MGIISKLKGELVDIIEWLEDSRSRLAWRFPRYQNEIKNGAQLIVREGQQAVFVYRGQLADTFGPGHYELVSENLPVLSTIQGWKHGFDSPFRSEVYFINTRPVTDLRWGTPTPITVRDPDFTMVQVRANGLCVLRIADPAIFLREVIGTDSSVDTEEISELLRRVIATAFSDLVMQTGLGAIDLQGRQVELADKLKDLVQERVDDEFGLKIDSIAMTISLPEEVTQAMTRGVARGVEQARYLDNAGPMDRLQQGAMAEAVVESAKNPGGAGSMMGAGLGMALGQQVGGAMAQGFGRPQQQAAPAPPPLPSAAQFHVELNGAVAGPFPLDHLRGYVSGGQLSPTTLVWTAGMAGWAAASTVPAVAALFQSTPPPLPPSGGN
ncbi:SPFH domain-containing protein [Actinokineospora pegani]|uniref:SPFH domain-containing protein n=1 Tax=Actinokineospora pegani TaxID=2654637 RepID=UPI0012E9E607|nr:SPFH domain-containing protein [Actinokineospora pegani]